MISLPCPGAGRNIPRPDRIPFPCGSDQVYGCQKTFTPEAMGFLLDQEWLGNIREIQNFMEKLYVLEDASVITDTLLKENSPFFPAALPPRHPRLRNSSLKTGGCRVPKNIYHGKSCGIRGMWMRPRRSWAWTGQP